VPPSADGTGEFAFGPPIKTLSIDSRQDRSHRLLTYEFETVQLVQL